MGRLPLNGTAPFDEGSPAWPNAAAFLLQHGRPGDTAIIDDGRSYTFAELLRAVRVLASELRDAGLLPGSRVGILGPNSFFWVAAYLATLHDHIAVPFSDKGSADHLQAQVTRVGCSAVFLDRRCTNQYAAAFDDGVAIISDAVLACDGALEGATASEPPPLTDPLAEQPRTDPDAVLLFTSGTTAAAKVVRLTHRNVVANTESIIEYLDLRADDKMMVVLPFYYCYGLSLLHTHLRVGGSLVLSNGFVFPEAALDQVEKERCTGFAGVPSTYQLLLRASSFHHREFPHLRHLQQAGGRLSPPLIEELLNSRTAARLFVMYGQTEATARLSFLPPELVLDKLGSVGRGIPGVELRVLDPDGNPVSPGEVGEIYAHGDNVSPGYFDDEAATSSKFPDGALRTGDLATVDVDGFVYIVDRVDDFIKSWGHRIASQEIEGCVLTIPDLISAAAVAIPDSNAGEAVAVAVTVRPGSAVCDADVLAVVRRQLPRYMIPRIVRVLDEMPLNANGKVDKARVRALLVNHTATASRE